MTIRQKQNLLAYLGYYSGSIDGIWGAQSQKAAQAFMTGYGLTGEFNEAAQNKLREVIFTEEKPGKQNTFWEEIQYFRKEEFACKCGSCGGFPAEPEETLVRTADLIREKLGVPILVSSGVRCADHNAAVGGVTNSRHLTGKAMDFSAGGKSAKEVLSLVRTYPQIRYAYEIGSGYVHMDIY